MKNIKRLILTIICFIFLISLSSCDDLKYDDVMYMEISMISDDTEYNEMLNELGFKDDLLTLTSSAEYDTFYNDLIKHDKSAVYPYKNDYDLENNDLVVYITRVPGRVLICEVECAFVNNTLKFKGCIDTVASEYQTVLLFFYLTNSKVDKVSDSSKIMIGLPAFSTEFGNVCYKPVIYLYSEEELSLNIKFKDESRLLTTYPKYNNGWNVKVKDNVINDGKNDYYALFFDEKINHLTNFEYGFNVSKSDAISFLEEKLDTLGFNYKERNECIMFWLPLLEKNEESIVYFEMTDERNEECPLELSITPDSCLRVIMHIKKGYNKNIKPQELESFERKGFTLLEWGGIIY